MIRVSSQSGNIHDRNKTRKSKLGRITNKYDFDGNAHQSSRVSWVLENKSLLVPAATNLSIKITSLCFCLLWFAFIPQEDAPLFELALQGTLYKILMPSSVFILVSITGGNITAKIGTPIETTWEFYFLLIILQNYSLHAYKYKNPL